MLESSSAAGVFAAALLFIGSSVTLWLLPAQGMAVASRAVERVMPWSAVGLAVALALRLFAHAAAAFDELTPHGVRVIAIESRWGSGWRVQFAVAIIALSLAAWHRRAPGLTSRVAATVTGVAVAFVLPLVGHAAATPVSMAIAGLHVAAVGVWLGTLSVLVLAGLGHGASPVASAPPVERVALFQRFSKIAFIGATVAIATGVTLAWRFVGAPGALVQTAYGRWFALKCGLFLGVCACGALNWRRARRGAFLAAPGWEVGLAGLIVLVTGFLTETAHP